MKNTGLEWLQETKVMVIARGYETSDLLLAAEALYQGGIRVIEVALNSEEALESIGALSKKFAGKLWVGAGTVLTEQQLEESVSSGAEFIVSPHTDQKLIEKCVSKGLAVFPGAMTPSEIVNAWTSGATAVKLFPGASFGVDYIKELRGPLNHIPMLGLGGISADNARSYIEAGCMAVGVGSYLLDKSLIKEKKWGELQHRAEHIIQKVRF